MSMNASAAIVHRPTRAVPPVTTIATITAATNATLVTATVAKVAVTTAAAVANGAGKTTVKAEVGTMLETRIAAEKILTVQVPTAALVVPVVVPAAAAAAGEEAAPFREGLAVYEAHLAVELADLIRQDVPA
ncbi:hypothetical protein AAVH_14019 [Aphelenchoides avenae]|nr:hypothetical protein AAVH_14019 [Aphelenchus avenae]